MGGKEMKKVAIVGAGLSGLVMAYNISKRNDVHVVILERGKRFEDRKASVGADLVSGEGGAGTVCGGKLCFPPASSGVWRRSRLRKKEFMEFKEFCLDSFITSKNFPTTITSTENFSMRSNMFLKEYPSVFLQKAEMQAFVCNLLDAVKKQGVAILHNCEFIDYEKSKEKFVIKCKNNNREEILGNYDYLILASGRLSSDQIPKWIRTKNAIVMQNPDLGIRFTTNFDKDSIFGDIGKDVKVKAKFGDIGVRTFCVCSGGNKAIVDINGMKYYDGHFEDEITNQVNLGILARSPYIHGYEGAALYCACLESYLNSDYSLKDFVECSDRLIKNTIIFSDILTSIKKFIFLLMQGGMIDENLDKYPVYFPSVDKLNPIIKTNQYFETTYDNLYIIGDAVGISRGFVQSMWSAYCASNHIMMKLEGQKQEESMVI